jgi:hypothetical protein
MVTARNYADYFPYGVSVWVRNLEFAADVNIGQPYIANLGAPLAAANQGFAAAVQTVSGQALTLSAGAGTLLNNGLVPHDSLTKRSGWGRGLRFVASGASTRTVVVSGYDYLGQRVIENAALAGATPVLNLKAIQWLDTVVLGAAADTVTVDIGYTNMFGLPYTFQHLIAEDKNYVAAANAGTFVAGLAEGTVSTATTADPRGTYLPVTVIPDGTTIFELTYMVRRGNLHGNQQFSG